MTYCQTCRKLTSNNKYCSKYCYIKDPTKKIGGYRNGSGRSKTGYYKGIYCGSTYELVWVIYQLDHNIKFSRFDGVLEGCGVKYIPDFIIDNIIYEMKGYEIESSVNIKTKLAESLGYSVNVLRKNDLQKEFDWVKSNYIYKNVWELYDNYKPKYTYECSGCKSKFTRDRKIKTDRKFCSRRCINTDGIHLPNPLGHNQYKKNNK